jgi:hypothetical protein
MPKETIYKNGTKKVEHPDGTRTTYYNNGDIKTEAMDGTIVYQFATTKAVQT